MFENLRTVIERQETVLLGRGTYDYWVDYWPTSDLEPFARFINGTDKHVFSAHPPSDAWPNTTFVTTSAVDDVAEMKQGEGGDIGIDGSSSLAGSLLRAGLVDELRLVVAPTLAGRGRRLFDDDAPMHRLELGEVERTSGGTLFLTYRRRE